MHDVRAVRRWTLERGAAATAHGARFEVWIPHAERAWVEVYERGGWRREALHRGRNGVFTATVGGVSAGADYRYELGVRGRTLYRPDPVSRWQPYGVHGSSRIVDPAAYRWHDQRWTGLGMADLVLYEIHVGAFSQAGTFDGVAERLGALKYLGVTAIELMPVAEFPGERNWGYDGVHLYAPESSYGGPLGLRRLVDAAHAVGLGVVLDVSYSRLGAEGNYLPDFGPYFTDRHRTPWGVAFNFDGADSDEVRRYIVDNALYWVREFHVDGLRLDAVHATYDQSARHVIEEVATAVHELGAQLGRRVVVVGQSEHNDPKLVRPPSRGGFGLDAVWSEDFHHAVHAALTGERRGVYVDYRGIAPLAKTLRDRFVYDGVHSAYHHRRHGAPAVDLPADRFVVFAQNHDQVGNRPRGERLASLVPPERLRLAAALVLLSPYVPLLFMGEEYGETSPFHYFASHDHPSAVGADDDEPPRRMNGDADPYSPRTFARSRVSRNRARRPESRRLQSLYRRLLRVRRDEPALRPGNAVWTVHGGAAGKSWVALELRPPRGRALFAAFNLADAQHIAAPVAGAWELLLSTDSERYGGGGGEPPCSVDGGMAHVEAPGWTALLYGCVE